MRGAYGGAAVLFYFIGIAHLPVGIATLLNYTAPVFTAIYAALFLGEAITRATLGALALTSVGVVHGHPGDGARRDRWRSVPGSWSGCCPRCCQARRSRRFARCARRMVRGRSSPRSASPAPRSAPFRRCAAGWRRRCRNGAPGRRRAHLGRRPAADDARPSLRARRRRRSHRAADAGDVAGARAGSCSATAIGGLALARRGADAASAASASGRLPGVGREADPADE